MKKLILAITVAALLLSCSIFDPPNPFVGTWSYSFIGMASLTFRADATCEQGFTDMGGTTTITQGTYSYTADQLDITWSDGGALSALYTITSTQLTLTPTTGGISLTLVKQ